MSGSNARETKCFFSMELFARENYLLLERVRICIREKITTNGVKMQTLVVNNFLTLSTMIKLLKMWNKTLRTIKENNFYEVNVQMLVINSPSTSPITIFSLTWKFLFYNFNIFIIYLLLITFSNAE